MKRVRQALVALLLGVALLWLLANDFSTGNYSRFWPLRTDMVHLSGLLAVATMSAAVYLAIRPHWLERLFDGLDKTYRLHKWLGIAALTLSTVHWGWAQVPKWLVGFGWLERPARRGAGQTEEGLLGWLHEQRGFAETIGEWAFYLAAALIVLALIKRFPYRWFFTTHRWLAPVYLVLVAHSLLLMPPAYWLSPLGAVMAALLLAGTLAAGVSLLRQVGRKRQVAGRIVNLAYHTDNRVLSVDNLTEPGQDTSRGSLPSSLSTRSKGRTHSACPVPGWATANCRSPSRGLVITPAPCPILCRPVMRLRSKALTAASISTDTSQASSG